MLTGETMKTRIDPARERKSRADPSKKRSLEFMPESGSS